MTKNTLIPHSDHKQFFVAGFLSILFLVSSTSLVFGYQANPTSPFHTVSVVEKEKVIDSSIRNAVTPNGSNSPSTVSHSSSLSPRELRVILGSGRNYDSTTKQWSIRERATESRRDNMIQSWVKHRARVGNNASSIVNLSFSEDPDRSCSGNCYPLLKYKR